MGGETRGEVGALEGVEALLLLAIDLSGVPASLSCSLGLLVGGLTQRLYWVVQDSRAIAKDGGLNIIFLNGLADLLDMELLKL